MSAVSWGGILGSFPVELVRVEMELGLVFKGPVRSGFLTPEGGNRRPQPVQTVADFWRTATEPRRTGPPQFGCGRKTGFNRFL
jgi:hypothetical protein